MRPMTRQPVLLRHAGKIIAGTVFALSLFAIQSPGLAQDDRGGEHWVGTWATAVVARPQTGSQPLQESAPLNFHDQTLRQIVHVSLGGNRVRVVLSNAFGTDPLEIGAAQIALRAQEAAIVPASSQVLTFGGRSAATIPAGAVLFSDPIPMTVPALADLAIDLYLPGDTAATTSPLTTHSAAHQTNYVSTAGNHNGAAELPVETTTLSWFFLSRVEVSAPEDVGAVVLLGDSITDGSRSTDDTNNRWPDHLARRFAAENIEMGVLNLGIGGNRLLTDGLGVSALARFDRDVLAQSGVTHVIVLEGINDIGLARNEFGIPRHEPPPTAADLIAAHHQLVERAHAYGLTIYGATATPFEGTEIPNYWSPEGDATRQAVNEWIRTSQEYDAVIEFEEVVRDPAEPTKILAEYDSGDHLHPGDGGYEAMANAVDLALLQTGAPVLAVSR
jgi:lysophospholipase L1-like esterase